MKRLLLASAFVGILPLIADATMYAPGTILPPEASDFSYFLTPTKWEPGLNSASVFVASPPAGPMTPGGASWSIMGAGLGDSFGDTVHGGNLTSAITALAVPTWTVTEYQNLFTTTLNVWASAGGFVNLGMVADGGVNAGASQASGGHLGDIRFAAWVITNANVLAHAYQPGTEAIFGGGGTIAGDLHIDTGWTWADDPTDTTGDADIDIFTVVLHELGHSLGLGHSAVVGSVMGPVYAGARRTLHADDIAGIQALYGPAAAAAVPEPTILALLALGGLCLWRQRHS